MEIKKIVQKYLLIQYKLIYEKVMIFYTQKTNDLLVIQNSLQCVLPVVCQPSFYKYFIKKYTIKT